MDAGPGCYSRKVENVVAHTIDRTTDCSTVEAIHKTCRAYEFGRAFMTYLQLLNADRKCEN